MSGTRRLLSCLGAPGSSLHVSENENQFHLIPRSSGILDRDETPGLAARRHRGLLFIGATKDEKFRAFDKRTGKVLWETSLPAGGYATPAAYEANGKHMGSGR